MDAPGLLDDSYLNLLDWGGRNILAIALGNAVYLWDASEGNFLPLVMRLGLLQVLDGHLMRDT